MQILLRRKNNTIPQDDWNQLLKLKHHMDDLEREIREGSQDHQQDLQNVQLIAKAGREYAASREELGFIELLVARVSHAQCIRLNSHDEAHYKYHDFNQSIVHTSWSNTSTAGIAS